MNTLKLCRAILLSAGIVLGSLTAHADFTPTGDPVPLKTLLEGGVLTSCDKTFTTWTFSAIGGASSLTFSVIPGYDEFGPGFRVVSNELFANTNQVKDVLLGFKVTSNGPLITDVHLRFGSALAGNGHTSVVEQARSGNGTVLGQIAVFNPPPVFEDTFTLTNAQSLLFITKDILMVGGNNTNPGASTITFVDQTFSQLGSIVCSINGPDSVCGGTSNHQFSGPVGAATYSWSITGDGVIDGSTTGQNISVTAGASGSFTVHLTVLNNACQSSTCEKTVTITEQPVCDISGNPPPCATSDTEHTAPAGMTSYAWSITGDATITGVTNEQTVTVHPTNNCSGSYTLFLTISNGCSSTCNKNFNYGDTTKPQITNCPQGNDLGCNPQTLPTCESVKALVTATDNCGTPTLQCVPASSIVGCNVELSFSIKAVDACGNESEPCIVTYTYKTDTTKPTIDVCPQGSDLGCNPETLPNCDSVKALATASDNCGTPTINCTSEDTEDGCGRIRVFTLTAVDGCNNESEPCIVRYTWKSDTTKPTIDVCPEGSNLGCNPQSLPDCDSVKALVTASDACGEVRLTCSSEDKTEGCIITRTFTVKAVDGCNNESDACIVVYTWSNDSTRPTIVTCLPDVTVYRVADIPECSTEGLVVSDNCGTPTVTCNKGDLVGTICNGSITYTYTAKDDCNNTATCTRVVKIQQEVPCRIDGTDKLCAVNAASNTCANYTTPDDGGSFTYQWGIAGNGAIQGATDGPTVQVCSTTAGSFTLTLTVTNEDGCTHTCTKTVTVELCERPCVPPPCCVNGKDAICANSAGNKYYGPSGSFTYNWTVTGNASIVGPSNTQTVCVTAGNSGSFTLKLVTSNGEDCSTTCCKTVCIVKAPECCLYGPDKVCADTKGIKFKGPNSDGTCGDSCDRDYHWGCSWNTSCNWSFYNNYDCNKSPCDDLGGNVTYCWTVTGNACIVGSKTSQTVCIDAGDCGSFTVTLTVKNSAGCATTCSKTVCIVPDPKACIEGPNKVCVDDCNVKFRSCEQAACYNWSVSGNACIVGDKDEQCVYVNPGDCGSFTLTLTVKNSNGCTSVTKKTVYIVAKPSLDLNAPTTLPECSSTGNKLVAPSGFSSYKWTVSGTGWLITSGANSQTLTYTAGSGTGTFCLIVKNSAGCEAIDKVSFKCRAPYTGCTPGFWKNWPQLWNGYAPDIAGITYLTSHKFNTVFGVTSAQSGFSDSTTLLQVLGTGGGCKQALGRHAVAALLNTKANNYPLSTAYVLSQTKTALLTNNCTTIEAFKDVLANYNELEGGICDNPPKDCK